MVGFKPSEEDFLLIKDLLEFYKSKAGFLLADKISVSDVLKTAIYELHESVIKDKENV
jgi:hypothetical protein